MFPSISQARSNIHDETKCKSSKVDLDLNFRSLDLGPSLRVNIVNYLLSVNVEAWINTGKCCWNVSFVANGCQGFKENGIVN